MVRFLGRDLANNKKIKYALTAIYGIGLSRAKEILDKAGLENAGRTMELGLKIYLMKRLVI